MGGLPSGRTPSREQSRGGETRSRRAAGAFEGRGGPDRETRRCPGGDLRSEDPEMKSPRKVRSFVWALPAAAALWLFAPATPAQVPTAGAIVTEVPIVGGNAASAKRRA